MGPRGDLVDQQFPIRQLKQFETKYSNPFQPIHYLTSKSGRLLGHSQRSWGRDRCASKDPLFMLILSQGVSATLSISSTDHQDREFSFKRDQGLQDPSHAGASRF